MLSNKFSVDVASNLISIDLDLVLACFSEEKKNLIIWYNWKRFCLDIFAE